MIASMMAIIIAQNFLLQYQDFSIPTSFQNGRNWNAKAPNLILKTTKMMFYRISISIEIWPHSVSF